MPGRFGRYELQDLLGRGGMGEVYRAYDTGRDRIVALKVLPAHLAEDESFTSRFRRESQLVARLNEPHIIPIHDFGEIDGQLFIDMRLVDGSDLGAILKSRGTLAPPIAVDIVEQVAAALDAAHAAGLVHRDVKPSNVLLTGSLTDPGRAPFAYLVDFGIARAIAQAGTALTATSATVGTIAYMAPERIQGEPGDSRTDTYALACVLYETITGVPPFTGEVIALMYAHLNTPPPRASALAPAVPPALDDVIAKGMAKAPQDRYPSSGAFAMAAREALHDSSDRSRTTVANPAAMPPPPRRIAPTPPPPTLPPFASPVQTPSVQGPRVAPTPPPAQARPAPTPPPSQSRPAPAVGPPPFAPSGPQFTPPPAPRRRSRKRLVIAAAAVAVVAGATAVVLATGGGDNGGSGSTNGPGSWSDFTAFSKLVGTTDHATTADVFKHGSCAVAGATSGEAGLGVVDKVTCTYGSDPVMLVVVRYKDAASAQGVVRGLIGKDGFRQLIWNESGADRGLAVVSANDATDRSEITSTICADPTYLVRISSDDPKTHSTQQLHDDYWSAATFPDQLPAPCDSTYLGSTSAATSGASVATKGVTSLTPALVQALVQHGVSATKVARVAIGATAEVMAVAQDGTASVWFESQDTLRQVGTTSYPYDTASSGQPAADVTGKLLPGMAHATFLVSGAFLAGSKRGTVAYTYGSKGWGAIVPDGKGDLTLTGTGVRAGSSAIVAGYAFADDRLETTACSTTGATCSATDTSHRFWTWDGSGFVLSGRTGP